MIGIFVNLWNRISGAGAYLLDEFGGAAAAYSLRKLSLNYGGPAIRVRRAFDNTEQDIGFAGNELDETSLMNFVGYQNLFQRSEEFGDAYWNKQAVSVTSNTDTDPFGGLNADLIIENQFATAHEIKTPTSFVFVVGQSYTFSVYAKQSLGTRNLILYLGTTVSFGSSRTAIFDLSTGQCVYNDAGLQFNSIPLANGWWRFSITSVAISSTTTIGSFIGMANGNSFPTNASYTGDGLSCFLIYGAQLNVGTTAQPYQVTTSAARSGDGFVTKWYTQDSNGENLLLQSQTFENAYWQKNQTSVSINATTAPDGTLTADKLTELAANDVHYIASSAGGMTTTQFYTISVYAKAAERSWIAVYLYDGVTSRSTYFNLSTGVTGTVPIGYNASIQSVGSGWYRCSVSATVAGSAVTNGGFITATGDNQQSYLGVVGSGVFIWGAQLSQSSWLQPYQATTNTAILRRDAIQTTAANQPRIVGGGVIVRENGKPSLFFDGVNDHFVGTDIALPTWSIFATAVNTVPSVTENTLYNRGTSAGSSRDALLYLNNVSKAVDAQRSNSTTFPTSRSYTSIQNYLVASGIFSGSQLSAFADSIAGAPVSTSVAGSLNPVTLIGATAQLASTAYHMGGEIGEIVVYNSDKTSTRADIERNIGSYYQTHWTGAGYGLLDQFGGAAAAYSLRNLSSQYRGPLIRVRRSSDNAETDIGGTYNGDLDIASLLSFTGGQNLVLESEDFLSASWTKTNSSVTRNVTIAPDGNLTADKFTETAVNGQHNVGFQQASSIAGVNTFSVHVKAAEISKVLLTVYLNSSPFDYIACNIDLSTASIQLNYTGGAYSVIGSSIQSVGNGWYRVSITGNITKGGLVHVAQLSLLNNSYQQSYLGVAGSGVYIWGAQLNTGILQPYIPTTTTAVNGANAFVTKWYDQSGLTRDAIQATAASQPRIVNAGGVESEGNRPALFFDGTDDRFVPSAFGDVFQNVGYANLFFAARNISTDANQRLLFSTSIGTIASTRFNIAKQSDSTIIAGGRRLDSDSFVGLGGGSFTESNIIGSALIQYQTSDAYLYSNNNLIASSTSFQTDGNTSNTASAAVSIGSDYAANVGSFWNGDMQELVFYNTNRFPNAFNIQSNINSYYRIYWQGNGAALLDNFGGASAAYSLRNLSSAYTGPLIRVRRSSDNVERDIFGTFGGDLDIASLVAFVGANSAFVTTWYDQSGSGRHAVQTTAGNQPRIVNAGVVDTENGKPTIFFDGTNDNLGVASGLDILQNVGYASGFSVAASNSTAAGYRTIYNISTNAVGGTTRAGLFINGTLYETGGRRLDADAYQATNGGVVNTSLRLLSNITQYQTSDAYLYLNNGLIASTTSFQTDGNTSNTASNEFRIGSTSASLYWSGDIQEVIVYNTNQFSSRSPIESNINNYYKIY